MTKLLNFLLVFFVLQNFAQGKKLLKGIIVSNAKPLEEVHIFNINTLQGVVTNKNGTFSLEVAKGDKLVISAMPYKEQHILITDKILTLNELKI